MTVSDNHEKVLPVRAKNSYLEGSRSIARQVNSAQEKMRRGIAEREAAAVRP
jgi:hypothetical protein